MRNIFSTVLLLFYLVAPSAAQKNVLSYIAPSDGKIQYTGRIDFSNPNAPLFYWPGTYLKAKFQDMGQG